MINPKGVMVPDIGAADAGAALPARQKRPAMFRLQVLLFYAAMPGLTVLNAAVGLLLPILLEPVEFGRYAVLVTLFQYGLVFDLGMSQLTDRRVPALIAAGKAAELASFRGDVLWTRTYIAILLVAGSVLFFATFWATAFPPAAAFLSLVAGVAFMIVLGPASFLRAASDRRAFGRINIAVMLILAVARPVGILLGGITGSFALLGLCYAAMAAHVHARMPLRLAARPPLRTAGHLLLQGVPLFLTSFVWAFYMTANRWVVSSSASSLEVGHFAFGSNVVTLMVGAVGSLAQYYYPRLVVRNAAKGPFAVSAQLRRDFWLLTVVAGVPTCVGIAAGPALIGIFYPKFADSVPVVQWLLLAMPSLIVASWLMPIALSTTHRPWMEGLVVYPTALAIQLAVTWAGLRLHGITGAAVGLAASAAPLLVMQLATLRLASLLTWRDGVLIVVAVAGVTLAAGAMLVWSPVV